MNPSEPLLYIVRVWPSQAGFRATARRLDEEQVHLFERADELTRFLTVFQAAPAAPPPLRGSESQRFDCP